MSESELVEKYRELVEECRELYKLPKDKIQKLSYNWRARDAFTHGCSWSIPCAEAVDAVKKWLRNPIHDPMAGRGLWAWSLQQAEMNVFASDLAGEETGSFCSVIKGDALDLVTGGEDLFLSWPPYEHDTEWNEEKMETVEIEGAPRLAFKVVSKLKPGRRLAYIGEGMRGCTGDHAFHRLIDTWKELESVQIPTFSGIHDWLRILEAS